MNERKIIRFRWKFIGGGQKNVSWSFGSLKSFYANMDRILYAGLCGIAAILIATVGLIFYRDYSRQKMEDSWMSYPIAHAMGAIDGYDYTNSLEAFEYNYAIGHRVFEVDFRFTSDGEIVCWHDWDQGYQEGIDGEHIPTREKFQEIQILGKYTALTLEDLILLANTYEDIYIVTDTKSDGAEVTAQFETILSTANELGCSEVLDRFLIQIYNDEMYKRVKSVYNFPTIIYTMYHSGWDGTEEGFLHFCRFCKNHDIRYITMWSYLARPEILRIANDYGLVVFAHTVNSMEEAEGLIRNGVKGVYTDVLAPSMFSQEE